MPQPRIPPAGPDPYADLSSEVEGDMPTMRREEQNEGRMFPALVVSSIYSGRRERAQLGLLEL